MERLRKQIDLRKNQALQQQQRQLQVKQMKRIMCTSTFGCFIVYLFIGSSKSERGRISGWASCARFTRSSCSHATKSEYE